PLQHRQQPGGDAPPPVVRAHRQLRARPLDPVGHIEVGIAGEGRPVVDQEVQRLPVAPVPQVQQHVLAGRGHPVGLGDGPQQGEYGVGLVAVESGPADDLGGHTETVLARLLPLGGCLTNLYPTLRTVPISTSYSAPSLARSRRTCTSTVRVPPK